MTESQLSQFNQLAEHYLGLESFEVTEELLDLCGAAIDKRALPVLQRRLREEETQVSRFQARGYIRMREKSEQLVRSLTSLITVLEEMSHDTASEPEGAQHRRAEESSATESRNDPTSY